MLERGVDVSYETIRRWTVKFGPLIAHVLRRRQPRPGDVCHLDEVVVKIAGRSYWLWRAVDQHGVVLEEILQSRRDKRAAKRLLLNLIKRWGFVLERIITDKLRYYGAAKREVTPGLDHWSHKGLNNRAENSHLPFRKRERVMQSATRNHFSVPACRRSAHTIRYHPLPSARAPFIKLGTARRLQRLGLGQGGLILCGNAGTAYQGRENEADCNFIYRY